jgi:hypothetical protein
LEVLQVSDPVLDRCVEEYLAQPGLPAEKMGAVLQYLADELMRDAFPYDYSGSVEIFIDALKLKRRLLEAVESHPETKTADYEVHLARLTEEPPSVSKKTADFVENRSFLCFNC